MIGKIQVFFRHVSVKTAQRARRQILYKNVIDGLLRTALHPAAGAFGTAAVVAHAFAAVLRGDVIGMRPAPDIQGIGQGGGIPAGIEISHKEGRRAAVGGTEGLQPIDGDLRLPAASLIGAGDDDLPAVPEMGGGQGKCFAALLQGRCGCASR